MVNEGTSLQKTLPIKQAQADVASSSDGVSNDLAGIIGVADEVHHIPNIRPAVGVNRDHR